MKQLDCPSCAAGTEFDPATAYARLARQNQFMAEMIDKMMTSIVATTNPNDAAKLTARSQLSNEIADVMARIVGGRPTLNYPHCALIGRQNPNGTFGWFCTGVLVHPRIVLSAGHCVIPNRQANVVALNVSDQNQLQNAELVQVRRLAVHPRYQQTNQLSDMTMIILRKEAITKPVKIASRQELVAASKTTLVGFGNVDLASTYGFGVKREVNVDITHLRRAGADNLDAAEQQLGFESDLEFVAGGNGFDSCNGDSGGPAYIKMDNKLRVAGLTSRATANATQPCGDGGIYTRIDAHLDFIRSVARDAGINVSF
jgi:secreted trypsin-like serine protease